MSLTLRRSRPQPEGPPRILLCFCQKCEAKWFVRMKMVPDPNPRPVQHNKRRKMGRPQRRYLWIYPPEEFERCPKCRICTTPGSKNQLILTKVVHTDENGRIKLRLARTTETNSHVSRAA